MSNYSLTPSAVLQRTKIDISETAGTVEMQSMQNFDAYQSRREKSSKSKVALMVTIAVLAVAAVGVSILLVNTLSI